MSIFSRRSALGIMAIATLYPFGAAAKTVARFNTSGSGNLALNGYDTTAYFTKSTAEQGVAETVIPWKGANWQFVSAIEAALFKAAPDAYAPQFGGYCTRAMSEGSLAPGDPEVWRLHKGKLYVFYAPRGGKVFDKDPDGMVAKAASFWGSLTLSE